MSDKDMVDVKELAKRLKVSANSIRNWVKSGRIPTSCYIQVNQTRRFDVDAVLDALRADRPFDGHNDKQLELPLGVAPAGNYKALKQPFVIDNDDEEDDR